MIVQTIPVTKSGDHAVIIEGDAGSVGQYTVSIYLNAAIEEENLTGAPNDDLSSAQELDTAFISLASAASTRAAVVGQRDQDRRENFESGSLNEEWMTFSTNAVGRIRVTDVVPQPKVDFR